MTDWGHVPVLPQEVMEFLQPRSGGIYADLTLGAGGHTELILEASSPEGVVLAFDRDPAAIKTARRRLEDYGERFEVTRCDFAAAPAWLEQQGATPLAGALLDLGVSSMQLDDPKRGFGFREDGPLDMRMSRGGKINAERIVATASGAELEEILREYGEEPRARAIANKIVEVRKRTRITRTKELAELVRSVTGSRGKTHPATRTFQALRIATNRELESIESVLPRMVQLLDEGARLVVISFHSLEDRLVKEAFRLEEKQGHGRNLTKKPIGPGTAELDRNRRSRSARLRVFERTGN
ncbi:MAG: 16S rRNA (cytosine(1402)-N(4))-methyltransferase RsmH [Planctomycetota bacterium]